MNIENTCFFFFFFFIPSFFESWKHCWLFYLFFSERCVDASVPAYYKPYLLYIACYIIESLMTFSSVSFVFSFYLDKTYTQSWLERSCVCLCTCLCVVSYVFARVCVHVYVYACFCVYKCSCLDSSLLWSEEKKCLNFSALSCIIR